ncbi:hypothetical protein AGMMS50267_00590 [Spirochaetia bacterium]|nr:hypothetical protein AGMMS50267_00590 [Spirochaetia bacterium]
MNQLKANSLKTRKDLEQSLIDLLSPLKNHAVPGGYLLGASAALYAPRIASMEGYCRTLWGIGPFAAKGRYPGIDTILSILREGVDPESPGYWGVPGDRGQRLVEMAAIALSLLLAKETFWDSLSEKTQTQLYTWLSFVEKQEVCGNNWNFFRILVCAAFRKLGLPVDEQSEKRSLDGIEACYRGDGWYQDGGDGNYDNYNPFAFHFYGLLYAKVAGERDPERAARYIERARLFVPRYAAWFREDGSSVPYGRSLTYRFAVVSLFSAAAFAGVEILPWGVLKGLVLRNLRWWFSQPILDAGGILSVGYAYPNLCMADQYNSPGSPYWALKTYLVLALGDDHPFWKAAELPLPEMKRIQSDKIPGFIISHGSEDVQLLTAGRYPNFTMNHEADKYCKFAYSARFGFCVSHSNYILAKTGCDSMLLLSEGDNYWRQRREVSEQTTGENWVSSVWKPWDDVRITTTLVSLGNAHVRLHRIESKRKLITAEGGFSLPRYHGLEEPLPLNNTAAAPHEALAAFDWGASRIIALERTAARHGTLVSPAPNLNVQDPCVVVPVLEGTLEPGLTILACAVRAGDRAAVSGETLPSVAFMEGEAEVFDGNGNSAGRFPLR